MPADREQYRESYRSTREMLKHLDGQLTDAQIQSILREAARKARQKELRIVAAGFVVAIVTSLIRPNTTLGFVVFALVFVAILIPTWIVGLLRARNDRTKRIGHEVMRILKRKHIRPMLCIACGHELQSLDLPSCPSCGELLSQMP